MTVLALDYRCCARLTPHYLKHAEVEVVAVATRAQLVGPDADAIPIAVLRAIEGLRVNGFKFELWTDTEHPVTDEDGQPVLGLCEFDSGAGMDAALLFVSPPCAGVTDELVLSTFGHELGHGIFDAPGWIIDSKLGGGLFDHADGGRRTYRTWTPDAGHFHAVPGVAEDALARAGKPGFEAERARWFAELRANEFMGSLLVPRDARLSSEPVFSGEHFGPRSARYPI